MLQHQRKEPASSWFLPERDDPGLTCHPSLQLSVVRGDWPKGKWANPVPRLALRSPAVLTITDLPWPPEAFLCKVHTLFVCETPFLTSKAGCIRGLGGHRSTHVHIENVQSLLNTHTFRHKLSHSNLQAQSQTWTTSFTFDVFPSTTGLKLSRYIWDMVWGWVVIMFCYIQQKHA